MVGLLRYYKLKRRHDDDEGKWEILPDRNGDLSKVVSSSTIKVTKAIVIQELKKAGTRAMRPLRISNSSAKVYSLKHSRFSPSILAASQIDWEI